MSEDAKRYNGWANYETWCVHLWLSNEEGSYRYWREEAERQRSEAPSCENVREGIWSVEDAAKFNLADLMKSELEEASPIEAASMFSDLLTAALSEVDWHEVGVPPRLLLKYPLSSSPKRYDWMHGRYR